MRNATLIPAGLFFLLLLSISAIAQSRTAFDYAVQRKSIEEKFEAANKNYIRVTSSEDIRNNFSELSSVRDDFVRLSNEVRSLLQKMRESFGASGAEATKTEQELQQIASSISLDITDSEGRLLATGPLAALLAKSFEESQSNVDSLRNTVSQHNAAVRDLRQKLSELSRSPDTEAERKSIQEEAAKAQRDLFDARTQIRAADNQTKQIKQMGDLVAKLISLGKSSSDGYDALNRIESIDTLITENISKIDNIIFRVLNIENNDKKYELYSTIVFGAAVVIVIVSFFYMANKSEDVRRSLFANDSGLQFVTLFALVIAIILFGVLKILEGRELAALLGGLSGYILGRGTIARGSAPGGGAGAAGGGIGVQGGGAGVVAGQQGGP